MGKPSDPAVEADGIGALHGAAFEDLREGMTAAYGRTITEADIVLYAGITGDINPVHLNQEYAHHRVQGPHRPRHADRGLISAVIGTKLPGPGAIYVNQTLRFKAPVRIGDTVVARVTVSALVARKRFVELKTACTISETTVLEGEATVMVPSRD